jgi:hypothetical protein
MTACPLDKNDSAPWYEHALSAITILRRIHRQNSACVPSSEFSCFFATAFLTAFFTYVVAPGCASAAISAAKVRRKNLNARDALKPA